MSCGTCSDALVTTKTQAELNQEAAQKKKDEETAKRVDLSTQLFSEFYWGPDRKFQAQERLFVSDSCEEREGKDVYKASLYLTCEGWVVEEKIWEGIYDDDRSHHRSSGKLPDPTRTNVFKSETFAPIQERGSIFHWHRSEEVVGKLASILDRLVSDLRKDAISATLTSEVLYTRIGREGRCDSPMRIMNDFPFMVASVGRHW